MKMALCSRRSSFQEPSEAFSLLCMSFGEFLLSPVSQDCLALSPLVLLNYVNSRSSQIEPGIFPNFHEVASFML